MGYFRRSMKLLPNKQDRADNYSNDRDGGQEDAPLGGVSGKDRQRCTDDQQCPQ